jgi:biopolymer transport protein ExbD
MKLKVTNIESKDDIDLTSMIDVVFLLVIFFMVTSTFIEEAKVYKIELPRAEKPETVSRDNTHSLSITADGQIYLKIEDKEDKIETLQTVIEKLKEYIEKSPEKKLLPVILRVDAHCEYSVYVQAKNALRLAGAELIFEEMEVKK